MSISTQLQELSNCKTNIKGAIANKGVDMTNVTFTDYPAKISEIEISAETVVYDYGTWNSDYAYATYIPSGASITFDDSYITLNGGGAVPQLGFTLKDEDVGRMVYMLIKPTTYSTTLSSVYRFGMGYQSTAVTSSDGGTETASARSIPYSSGAMVDPALVGIPALEKYIKIFVGASQIANVYKIWLGEKYIAPATEETTWTYKTGNLVKMTSNSAPSPFKATYKTSGGTVSGSAYQAFDNGTSTSLQVSYPNAADLYVQLDFGKSIKVGKFTYNMTASGQSTYSNYVKGIKADGSTVNLKSNTTCSGTVTVTDGNEYTGIRFGCTGRTDLIFNFKELQITEWYEAS